MTNDELDIRDGEELSDESLELDEEDLGLDGDDAALEEEEEDDMM